VASESLETLSLFEVAATTWHILWEKIHGILPFPRATDFTEVG